MNDVSIVDRTYACASKPTYVDEVRGHCLAVDSYVVVHGVLLCVRHRYCKWSSISM